MIRHQELVQEKGLRVESFNLHTPPGPDPCFVMASAGRLTYAGRFVMHPFSRPSSALDV